MVLVFKQRLKSIFVAKLNRGMLHCYAVLKGRVTKDLEDKVRRRMTHHNVIVSANGDEYQFNIDTQSSIVPNVKMLYVEEFSSRILAHLDGLEEGLSMLGELANDHRLDYLRNDVLRAEDFESIEPKPWKEISDVLDEHIKVGCEIYCLGDYYDDEQSRTHIPHGLVLRQQHEYLPPRGIHDAHMNQGTPLTMPQCRHNGVYQDGAVLIRTADNKMKGLFFVFTSQSLRTDESGNPITNK
ncbi:uncharacterized protein VICG_02077 [Vittaforma corneae ATCC 50505]|uniref:Uncharacterized protein n=1 Tax=Vittaforma corneae (strain ATCC 50505) TaxID=993615 RepID=L2GKS2_VITCO|nr:uncharacterized protein VICG_02077 [Vittaforma corneae ATCC 50505]ELA40897.1 hypothetical protein VICG_02077 [Vittaforma corneae ATCC 50505]